jgi:hypothetical protein
MLFKLKFKLHEMLHPWCECLYSYYQGPKSFMRLNIINYQHYVQIVLYILLKWGVHSRVLG